MKKLFAIILTVAMLATLSVSAFAAGAFVGSPTASEAPVLSGAESKDPDAPKLVITTLKDMDKLPEDVRAKFEVAYKSVTETEDITTLNEDIAKTAEKLGVETKDLAVSDFFDLSPENYEKTESGYKVTLEPENIEQFVGLLHYVDGKWVLVENAKVVDGKLVFEIDSFSPFAIITSTGATPERGSNTLVIVLIVVAAVVVVGGAGAGAYFYMKKKKAAAN